MNVVNEPSVFEPLKLYTGNSSFESVSTNKEKTQIFVKFQVVKKQKLSTSTETNRTVRTNE